MTFQLPDPSTPFGERVARRLRDERLIWFTTVDAYVSTGDPSADRLPTYVEKYRDFIVRSFETPEKFASIYPVALRIRPIAIRGH